jgi:hypothetical protein
MEPNYGYKHTKGFVILVLIFIIGCISVAYGQVVSGSPNTPSGYSIDSTTGNLIPNGSLTSATGWSSTTGSPSWTPNGAPLGSFDPTNGYTFSYIPESLGQNPGINLGSFNHGYLNSGAVFVTGFSYGLTYRFPCANSIGTNCDGTSQTAAPANPTQDNLRVEVGYYPSTGNPTFYTHQLGLKNINDGNPAYNPNWQTLAQTVTFAGAKPLAQAGSVNFEIIGSDAGGWACLNGECYGPQVKNAYIRANYSVDPCILNPAFNPSCSGFQNILQGSKSPAFYYSYNIAQSLPHIGGGVILHGYDYGFNWYNYGACYNTFIAWCTDWRTDGGGNINFRISDKNNTTMLQQQWYVSGNNNAGSYSNRYLFTESRNSLDMGSVQWWASDVWNHFGWVGWTRPIWTPDPCYTNGLYSPNCSNFQSTLTQVIADVKEQQERIAALTPVTTSSSTPAPGGEITVTIGNANSATPSVTVNTAVNTNTGSEQSGTSSNTQFALSLVQGNQRREQTIAIQASQTARSEAAARAEAARSEAIAIADANQQQGAAAADAAAEAAQASGTVAVPGRVGTQSAQISFGSANVSAASMTAGAMLPLPGATRQTATVPETIMPNEPANTGSILAVRMPEPQPSSVQQVTTAVSVAPPYQAPQAMDTVQLPKQEPMAVAAPQVDLAMVDNRPSVTAMFRPTTPTVDTTSLPPAVPVIETPAVIQTTPVATVETRTIEADSATSPTNFVTNRTNPITSIVEGRAPAVDSGAPKTELAAVNKTVAPNELAAGMDIDRIAITPQGFNVYASLVLRDAAFYAPREIYRGQRTVDNVRALRGLGQDARHQEMVDQQYRR